MQNIEEIVRSRLLDPYGIDDMDLQTMLGQVVSNGIEMGDIYFQSAEAESWTLEDGQVKKSSYSSRQGVGFRSIIGEQTGLAYSESFEKESLMTAAKAASSIAKAGKSETLPISKRDFGKPYYLADNPILSIDDQRKIDMLNRLDEKVRSLDSRVKEVIASLAGAHGTVLILNQDGRLATDIRPMVRLSLSVIAEDNGRIERGTSGGGGRMTYEFMDDDQLGQYAKEAVDQALINLEADEAPAGEMTVVLGSGWPGVLIHEAIGHGLEGDFNRKKTSAFSGLMGEMVASPICTIVDDGTIEDARGSLNIDDEGNQTERTVLIENGKLCNYMQDNLNAKLMNTKSTGNGRRESYSAQTIPRMTNTFMLAGEHDQGEIIESVDKGLYAKNFGGGQVDITSGKFVFSASEAYLIEKGNLPNRSKAQCSLAMDPLRCIKFPWLEMIWPWIQELVTVEKTDRLFLSMLANQQ
ncbi:MAG: peptidase C69 [Pseudomonadota bacterium]|nr:MAG: peptidase C69 [Pseudomonadota bacterium]